MLRSDKASLCEGCFRSIEEIVAWGRMSDAAKLAVWAQLPSRGWQGVVHKESHAPN